jgi:hypothetical protein
MPPPHCAAHNIHDVIMAHHAQECVKEKEHVLEDETASYTLGAGSLTIEQKRHLFETILSPIIQVVCWRLTEHVHNHEHDAETWKAYFTGLAAAAKMHLKYIDDQSLICQGYFFN